MEGNPVAMINAQPRRIAAILLSGVAYAAMTTIAQAAPLPGNQATEIRRNVDLTGSVPPPPYERIYFEFFFTGDTTAPVTINTYGGHDGANQVHSNNWGSNFIHLEVGGEFDGKYALKYETANVLFNPILDGLFSFGIFQAAQANFQAAQTNLQTAQTGDSIFAARISGLNYLTGAVRQLSRPQTFYFDQVNGAVPEPSAWALMILGFGMLGAGLRRKRAVVAYS